MEKEMKEEEKYSVANQKRVRENESVGGNSNIPMVGIMGWGMDIMRKRQTGEFFLNKTPGRKRFGENTVGRNYLGKLTPRTSYVDKRALGIEFIGKRAPRMEFVEKRVPERNLLGKDLFKYVHRMENK